MVIRGYLTFSYNHWLYITNQMVMAPSPPLSSQSDGGGGGGGWESAGSASKD